MLIKKGERPFKFIRGAGMARVFLSLLAGLSLLLTSVSAPRASLEYKDQVAVLAYHHIDETAESFVTITPELFRNQLLFLKNKGYTFINLTQFDAFMKGAAVPPNAVMITFDDGYESFYTKAYPILKELSIPAISFVVTKDLADPMGSMIPSLSVSEIQKMVNPAGFMEFQCHSDSLHERDAENNAKLTSKLVKDGVQETLDEYRGRISEDTNACVNKLSKLNPNPVHAYAYPFGIFDQEVIRLLNSQGITLAFTTEGNMATRDRDPMKIPRLNAGAPFVNPTSIQNLIAHSLSRR
jgi:peptidoglycan/xylan/chitin deacetylase (PgdA/CDA1 family)